jgi:isopentenyl phosphate kinase
MTRLVFLKLGGSLITDKTRPYTPRPDILRQLCEQIAAAPRDDLRLLLGHGSGSFGHTVAREYGTRRGVVDARGWQGFAQVHHQAATLNRYVMDALQAAGLSAMAFPPSAAITASNGQVALWETTPIRMALANDILPVVYGDVVFDEVRGGTILSTEDLFEHLALQLHPDRILLAGLEAGVWADFPQRTQLIDEISLGSYTELRRGVGAADGADVTGGMESKVRQMLELVRKIGGLEVRIFSAQHPGDLARALAEQPLGTRIALG